MLLNSQNRVQDLVSAWEMLVTIMAAAVVFAKSIFTPVFLSGGCSGSFLLLDLPRPPGSACLSQSRRSQAGQGVLLKVPFHSLVSLRVERPGFQGPFCPALPAPPPR